MSAAIIPSMWSSFVMEESPEQMVRTMLQYGYRCTELSDEHSAVLLDRGDPETVGAEFKRFMDEQEFSTPQGHLLLHCDLSVGSAKEKADLFETFRKWFALYHALNVKAAVLHPGGLRHGAEYRYGGGEVWDNTVANLSGLLQLAEGASFTICLENLPRTYPTDCELEQLIAAVPGGEKLGICLDTGHLALNHGNCAEFIRRTASRLKALHITDCIDCPDGGKHDHFFPTTGCIDWRETVRALRSADYHGLFNYEVPRERQASASISRLKLEYSRRLADLLLEDPEI